MIGQSARGQTVIPSLYHTRRCLMIHLLAFVEKNKVLLALYELDIVRNLKVQFQTTRINIRSWRRST